MNGYIVRALAALVVIAAPAGLTGCSVGMALSGETQPDLAVCSVGAERSEIELQLGKPTAVSNLPDGGQACTYEYQLGNEPSPGRAVVHGAMDVLTMGLWEVVGTPVEAVQGKKYRMTVDYDSDGRTTRITTQPAS